MSELARVRLQNDVNRLSWLVQQNPNNLGFARDLEDAEEKLGAYDDAESRKRRIQPRKD